MVKGSPYKPNPFRYTTAALLSAAKTAQESNLVRQVLAGIPQASAKALDDLAQQNKDLASQISDRKSTRLNSSHSQISYAVFCLKKKKTIDVLHETYITTHLTPLRIPRRNQMSI